jgi:hypothetical protein
MRRRKAGKGEQRNGRPVKAYEVVRNGGTVESQESETNLKRWRET